MLGTWLATGAGGMQGMAKNARKKSTPTAKARKKSAPAAKPRGSAAAAGKVAGRRASGTGRGAKLLAGGNPQIPKGEGDAPVQAYVAAMPGWKRGLGERLDALIVDAVPDVQKAVKWNSPLYGVAGRGWFLSFHCFTKYVKVAFFRGAALRPAPPGASRQA